MTGFYFTIHISNSLINSAIIEVRCYQSFKDTESESKSQQAEFLDDLGFGCYQSFKDTESESKSQRG